jgi:hypothetical protein
MMMIIVCRYTDSWRRREESGLRKKEWPRLMTRTKGDHLMWHRMGMEQPFKKWYMVIDRKENGLGEDLKQMLSF